MTYSPGTKICVTLLDTEPRRHRQVKFSKRDEVHRSECGGANDEEV